jgi:hypothetical protein
LDIDWEEDGAALKEYRVQVMIYHLVAAAQSLIRARDPARYDEDPYRDRTPVIAMRDISIGYKDRGSIERLVVSCHEQPGTVITAREFDPQWDIASDDGIDRYEGSTKAEREHLCLEDLLSREKARRDTFRNQILRLRTIHTHTYEPLRAKHFYRTLL